MQLLVFFRAAGFVGGTGLASPGLAILLPPSAVGREGSEPSGTGVASPVSKPVGSDLAFLGAGTSVSGTKGLLGMTMPAALALVLALEAFALT